MARLDRRSLADSLRTFGGTPAERRAVARAAGDLADDGRFSRDQDHVLTGEVVRENLADAPEGGPAERWNWWMGSLEVAHGRYERFRVTAWDDESDRPDWSGRRE